MEKMITVKCWCGKGHSHLEVFGTTPPVPAPPSLPQPEPEQAPEATRLRLSIPTTTKQPAAKKWEKNRWYRGKFLEFSNMNHPNQKVVAFAKFAMDEGGETSDHIYINRWEQLSEIFPGGDPVGKYVMIQFNDKGPFKYAKDGTVK